MNCHAADNFYRARHGCYFYVCGVGVQCRSGREYSFVLKVGYINSLFQIFDFRREDFVSE